MYALYETLAMIFSDEKRNSKYKRERANELYSVNRKRIIKNAA